MLKTWATLGRAQGCCQEKIFLFDLSANGKQMVLARGNVSNDVFSIVDAKR